MSATELDIGEAHNTFFDEYDTYVKTDPLTVDNATFQQQQNHTFALLLYLKYYKALNLSGKLTKVPCSKVNNHSPAKIFLRNSVWRI